MIPENVTELLHNALADIEWSGDIGEGAKRCPSCEAFYEGGHWPDCSILAALSAYEEAKAKKEREARRAELLERRALRSQERAS